MVITKSNYTNIKTPANVKHFYKFEDASGAEAVIIYRGYTFACNYLGKPSLHLIKPVQGTRVENKIAVDICRKAYSELISLNCDENWLTLNAAMYSQESRIKAEEARILELEAEGMTTSDAQGVLEEEQMMAKAATS